MRVRRPSDSVEQDVAFRDGYMDQDALAAFIAGETPIPVTWYGQKNGINLTLLGTTGLPSVVTGVSAAYVPVVRFPGATGAVAALRASNALLLDPFTAGGMIQVTARALGSGGGTGGFGALWTQHSPNFLARMADTTGTVTFRRDWSNNDPDWIFTRPSEGAAADLHVFACVYNDDSTANVPTVYVDGVAQSFSTPLPTPSGSPVSMGNVFTIGNTNSSTSQWFGDIHEVLHFASIPT